MLIRVREAGEAWGGWNGVGRDVLGGQKVDWETFKPKRGLGQQPELLPHLISLLCLKALHGSLKSVPVILGSWVSDIG